MTQIHLRMTGKVIGCIDGETVTETPAPNVAAEGPSAEEIQPTMRESAGLHLPIAAARAAAAPVPAGHLMAG